jgi:hypothetical protein
MRSRTVLRWMVVVLACISGAARSLDVYHIGNSLTDETYGMHDVARGKGAGYITWGRHMTPGCPLWLIWRDREDKTGYLCRDGQIDWSTQSQTVPYQLDNNDWDAVVMQIYPMNGDGVDNAGPAAEGFAGLIYDRNPDCQLYILTSHADAGGDWTQEMSRVSSIYEPIANRVTAAYPSRKPCLVVPVLQVMNHVATLIQQGAEPGLGTIESYYQDDGGHLGPKGLYMAALTMYATLYKSDPDGAVISGLMYWQYADGYSVSQDFANLAYDIVWDVVCAYPMSGVSATPVSQSPLRVAQPARVGIAPRPLSLLGRELALPRSTMRGEVAPGCYILNGASIRR